MCGRYTVTSPADLIEEVFDVGSVPEMSPRYNVAPTQEVAAIRRARGEGSRHFAWLRWGLVPCWAKDASGGSKLINARAETAAEKPSFRDSFRRHRCLLVADGFFEWRKPKEPFHFSMADGRPFAIAGLWAAWQAEDGRNLESCTLLTTRANSTVRRVHHRMPVILPSETWDLWLDPDLDETAPLIELLRPCSKPMKALAVGPAVNKAMNEGPELLQPPEPDPQGSLF